ncbi:MAG: type II toxin-antitoxin system RelE/ParE family toxin [Bacteroidetes bacterium]|nr:type II toxin-antitoxin system RelE/ParE family toxin [Bacteroidota bacterium]
MKTEFLRHFEKDIDKLSQITIRINVSDAVLNVEKAKKISEIKGLKKLAGFKNVFRIKIGDYRIGLFIENDVVEFARVVHRKDIYKVFP